MLIAGPVSSSDHIVDGAMGCRRSDGRARRPAVTSAWCERKTAADGGFGGAFFPWCFRPLSRGRVTCRTASIARKAAFESPGAIAAVAKSAGSADNLPAKLKRFDVELQGGSRMAGDIEARLQALGLELPAAPVPVANYVPACGGEPALHLRADRQGGRWDADDGSRRGRDLTVEDRSEGGRAVVRAQHSGAGEGGARLARPHRPGRAADGVRQCGRGIRRSSQGDQRGVGSDGRGARRQGAAYAGGCRCVRACRRTRPWRSMPFCWLGEDGRPCSIAARF